MRKERNKIEKVGASKQRAFVFPTELDSSTDQVEADACGGLI